MVLGKLPVPGRPTIWIAVGQGPTALAVGAGGGCLDIFTLIYPFSPLSPSLWETARYRLKYCLKGPLNPKQPTIQICIYPKWSFCHQPMYVVCRQQFALNDIFSETTRPRDLIFGIKHCLGNFTILIRMVAQGSKMGMRRRARA